MKRTVAQKIAMLISIPIAVFVIFASFTIANEWRVLKVTEDMARNVGLISSASALVSTLQKERGFSSLFLMGVLDRTEVAALRRKTDSSEAAFRKSLAQAKIPAQFGAAARRALSGLAGLRSRVDGKISPAKSTKLYTDIIETVLATESAAVNAKTTGGIGKKLADITLFENAGENAGRLRNMLSGLLAANRPLSTTEVVALMDLNSRIFSGLESPALSIPEKMARKIRSFAKDPVWVKVSDTVHLVLAKAATGNYGIDPKEFFQDSTRQIATIQALKQEELAIVDKVIGRLQSKASSDIWHTITLVFLLAIGMAGVSMVIGQSISRPVTGVAKKLSDSSEKVSAAALELSTSSHRLSEGASQQAAALEETSSSLEQMSSMTRRNAENADAANQLMRKTRETVALSGRSINELAGSMQDISTASEETSKIIKTIDEIAFQTNLLALNAAVEAARAGEAGAGFAVVADEVRNLAMRAAEAAKTTSHLIEGTVQKIGRGTDLAQKSGKEFHEVVEAVGKASELIGEISAASLEQAQGIEQVNKAVGEVDKVIQQNAAGAEEAASVSSEMHAQSDEVKRIAKDLWSMVNRSRHAM